MRIGICSEMVHPIHPAKRKATVQRPGQGSTLHPWGHSLKDGRTLSVQRGLGWIQYGYLLVGSGVLCNRGRQYGSRQRSGRGTWWVHCSITYTCVYAHTHKHSKAIKFNSTKHKQMSVGIGWPTHDTLVAAIHAFQQGRRKVWIWALVIAISWWR